MLASPPLHTHTHTWIHTVWGNIPHLHAKATAVRRGAVFVDYGNCCEETKTPCLCVHEWSCACVRATAVQAVVCWQSSSQWTQSLVTQWPAACQNASFTLLRMCVCVHWMLDSKPNSVTMCINKYICSWLLPCVTSPICVNVQFVYVCVCVWLG